MDFCAWSMYHLTSVMARLLWSISRMLLFTLCCESSRSQTQITLLSSVDSFQLEKGEKTKKSRLEPTQREEQNLRNLWLPFEIWVDLVCEQANYKLLTGWLGVGIWCLSWKKVQIAKESDDCIVWKTEFSKVADLVDTHCICPIGLLAHSMAGLWP